MKAVRAKSGDKSSLVKGYVWEKRVLHIAAAKIYKMYFFFLARKVDLFAFLVAFISLFSGCGRFSLLT